MALPLNTSSVAALASGTTLLGGLTNLLAASPQTTQGYQPQNVPSATGLISLLTGPSSLLFHYEGENTATFSSDITDHFIEDNTAVQDQIALKPVLVTVHGFIGELNNVPPAGLGGLLQLATNTLSAVGAFAPGLSSTAQNAYNQASAGYMLASSLVNTVVSGVSSLGGTSGESVIGSIGGTITKASNQNKQQTYFQQFYGYWQTRTLFTIQTPWAIFQNMAILNVRAIQDESTRVITDFEVSFKQMNFTSAALGAQLQTQARLQSQSALLQSAGTNALNPASTSIAGATANQVAQP